MQCVILAGGRGIRLGALTAATPKALVDLAGRPFLHYQLELLRRAGVKDIVLCIGYLGSRIEQAIGDGSRFGLAIRYSDEGSRPLGTAGALRNALPLLDESFMVTYGDTLLSVDYGDVERAFRDSQLPALMTVLENDDQFGASNARVAGGLVTAYSKDPTPAGARWIDYGLIVLKDEVVAASDTVELPQLLAELAQSRRLGAYEVCERFYEIGDPASLAETTEYVRTSPRFAELRARSSV